MQVIGKNLTRKMLIRLFLAITIILFSPKDGFCFKKFHRLISYDKLMYWMHTKKDFVLVDTLSPIEYEVGTIPGAINIPMEVIYSTDKLPGDKTKTIVFFCKGYICHKSHKAAYAAEKMGYTNVFVFPGGTPEWLMQGNYLQVSVSYEGIYVEKIFSDMLDFKITYHKPILVVDIQDEAGYEAKHIPSSVNIPLAFLHERYNELPPDKEIILVDRAGRQSLTAGRFLKKKGFNDIKYLSGGIEEWEDKGFSIEEGLYSANKP